MNDKFYEQKKEKQDIMINGAMKVFALNGYKHSSIDDMVKEAGVSKGLWFHYFENKKGLYSFVISYGIKYAILEYGIKIEKMITDFYDLILDKEAVKISLMEKYPYLPLLILSVMEEEDLEAVEVIEEMREAYREQEEKIFEFADITRFENTNYSGKISKMIDATFNRMLRQYYKEPVFLKREYLLECESYIKMLTDITYKM